MHGEMNDFTAMMICEGQTEVGEETQIQAWQHLIDTGLAWQLQGAFGRQAVRMIDEGVCHYARG